MSTATEAHSAEALRLMLGELELGALGGGER